jgi:hypothetical protein
VGAIDLGGGAGTMAASFPELPVLGTTSCFFVSIKVSEIWLLRVHFNDDNRCCRNFASCVNCGSRSGVFGRRDIGRLAHRLYFVG